MWSNQKGLIFSILTFVALATACLTPDSVWALGAAPKKTTSSPSLMDQPQPVPTTDFDRFIDHIVVTLEGRNWYLNERDIDRMVGDPWTLNAATAGKVRALPPLLRIRLYAGILDRFRSLDFSAGNTSFVSTSDPARSPMVVTMEERASRSFVSNILSTLTGHFRPEELVDLAVYLLSKFSFFPKTEEGWKEMRSHLVQYDLWVALAAVMASIVTTNKASFGMSSWLVNIGKDKLKIGWYGSAREMGLDWSPTFRLGGKVQVTRFEASGGMIYHENPAPNEEVRAFEISVREHWLELFGKLTGWEFAASAYGKYLLEHGNPDEEGKFYGRGDFYARRANLFNQPALSLLMSAVFLTDFEKQYAGATAIAIEDTEHDLTAAMRFGVETSKDVPRNFRVGVLVGGRLDGEPHKLDKDLFRAGTRLRESVENLQDQLRKLDELEGRLNLFGTGVYRADQERALVDELKYREGWVRKAVVSLKTRLDNYLESRDDYYHTRGYDISKLTDQDGVVDQVILQYARKQIYPGGKETNKPKTVDANPWRLRRAQ